MTGQAVAIGLSASLVLCLTGGTVAAQDVARADVAISVDKVPAEDTAAAVTDPNWKAPRTSWAIRPSKAPGAATT